MTGEKLAQRNYYGKALAELAEEDPNIVVLDADLAGSTKTSSFKKVCPDRFVEVGIAEADMIGIASGLAASGKTVFASTFGVFASGRCWEQIRLGIAYPKLDVKVVATHCGISVGADGASHQALEDVAVMRAIPNMTVIVPADAYETYAATKALAKSKGPAYMRMGRADVPVVTEEGAGFEIGKATVLKEGSDVSIVACGQMVYTALSAAEELKGEGIEAEVINMSTIKPLDTDTLSASVSKTGCCVTAEEHSVIGGLGSAVAEFFCENKPVPMERVGTKDVFGQSGDASGLMKEYGLEASNICEACKRVIGRKE